MFARVKFIASLAADAVSSLFKLENPVRKWLEIRRSAIFDGQFYIAQLAQPEQAAARMWPIMHYLLLGESTNTLPNPLFMTPYYRQQMTESGISGSPLLHYVREGYKTTLKPNPVFVSAYYSDIREDVARTAQNPLGHYYHHGWREGLDPAPWFNSKSVAARFPELATSGEIPMARYLREELSESTELWGLPPGRPMSSPKAAPTQIAGDRAASSDESLIDLIVPVYRRPDLVMDLFDSLLASPDWNRVSKCVVVDDRGDTRTSAFLQTLSARDPKRIAILTNDENLGFLRSCNRAFQKTTADFVVLVNSDIQVPRGWLSRLIRPMNADKKIALVTPLATSGANLSVALRPGQTWVDADRIVSSHSPIYPSACTAIGYAMAIRRSAIGDRPLFDEVFLHGYGEDTDLHYRLITAGWKSVICDNLIVFHKGSASYILDNKKDAVYDANRKVFFERWGKIHAAEYEKFTKSYALSRLLTPSRHTVDEETAQDIDILFVSPTNATQIGGVKIIFQLAAYLAARGIKAKVFCHRHTGPIAQHAHDLLMPVLTRESLARTVARARVVVGTGIGVAPLATELAKQLRASLWWLVQGPECYFSSGEHYDEFKKILLRSDQVISVSEYLDLLIRDFGVKQSHWIPLGPDPLVFYPRDIGENKTGKGDATSKRDPKSIAVQLIDTPDKGARFAVSFAEEARRRGLSVHFFGTGKLADSLPRDLGEFHGQLDPDGLAKLFSKCGFYLDLSVMEGLGLLPLEAAFCGCRPVMTRKGAPDKIFSATESAVILDSHLDYQAGVEKILASSLLPAAESARLAETYNARRAYAAFETIFKRAP